MNEKIKKSCKRLTPSEESKINMFNNITECLDERNIAPKKMSFIKCPALICTCIGVSTVCILGTSFVIKANAQPLSTPIYSLAISNHHASLRKAYDVVETSELVNLKDRENYIYSSSDKGYTITFTNSSVNGQLVNLFFDLTQNDNKKIDINSSAIFSNLDMLINCKLTSNNQAGKSPIFEWFMLEDTDVDDNKIQFGMSLWNDIQADTAKINVTNLRVGNSKNIFIASQTIPGNWNLTIPLNRENENSPREEHTYDLNQELVYQETSIILTSATYSPGTLSIELKDPHGSLNKKPFVDEIIKIETNQTQIYPTYGAGSSDGTTRSILYELEDGILPENIKNLIIGNLKFTISLKK